MFSRVQNSVFYNRSLFEFDTKVECRSNIIEINNRKYINVKVLENLEILKQLDRYCQSNIKNYLQYCNNENIIFVKLPFRYKRFDISFNNLLTSDLFNINESFNCTIKFGGFVTINDNQTICLKITKVF